MGLLVVKRSGCHKGSGRGPASNPHANYTGTATAADDREGASRAQLGTAGWEKGEVPETYPFTA